MSGRFKSGTSINIVTRRHQKVKLKYIRVKAGPQRDRYVHELVCMAKIIGRRESWEREHPGVAVPTVDDFYLLEYETVDHDNGNSLDNWPTNLIPMTNRENVRRENDRRRIQRRKADADEVGNDKAVNGKADKVAKKKQKSKWVPDPNVPF